MEIRLNKYLSLCGLGSRRKTEELIKEGRVSINKNITTNLATVVDTDVDTVRFEGKEIAPIERKYYLMLNKPKGYITSLSDEKGRATVMDLLPEKYMKSGVVPVGRLDKDTEGILILTNDGDLAHRLTGPEFKVKKEYLVEIDKPLEEMDLKRISKGFFIHQIKTKTRPAKLSISDRSGKFIKMSIREGKKRQIRYSFKNLGYRVVRLKRIGYGPLEMQRLNKGEFRELKSGEVRLLKKTAGNSNKN